MLYAVSPFMQKKEVDEYCFKACGEIICGAIEIGEYGGFFPCREDICEHEDKHTEVMGNINGEDVCIRKLKEN